MLRGGTLGHAIHGASPDAARRSIDHSQEGTIIIWVAGNSQEGQQVTHFAAIQKIHKCECRCPVYLVAYVNVEAPVAKSAAETREMNQEIVLYHAVGARAPSARSRRLSTPSDAICRASC